MIAVSNAGLGPTLGTVTVVDALPAGLTATRVYDGDGLRAGNTIDGPAVIERMGDSVVVPPDFRAQVDRLLTIRLAAASAPGSNGTGSAGHAEAA